MSEHLKTLAINGLRKFLSKYNAEERQQKAQTSVSQSPKQSHEENKADLDRIAFDSHDELAKFRGVWPFDFFPDEVIINRTNITIIRHYFFFVSQKIICHFDDLVNAHVNAGPFFGSLSIYSKYFTDGQEDIKWFSRNSAERIHAILQGLLIARKEGVDIKTMSKEEIIPKLYQIGKR